MAKPAATPLTIRTGIKYKTTFRPKIMQATTIWPILWNTPPVTLTPIILIDIRIDVQQALRHSLQMLLPNYTTAQQTHGIAMPIL